ncbi:MAG: flavin reductase family protein [Aeromicrobium sp.]|uniref:flavin reductase family protein n=1 Tax=Aeromicrobium sp. TaxID=1871063 RepID=UPI003C35C22C
MSIHSDHPFATPEGDRDPLRRLRGRMAAPVTVWTTGTGKERHGLTISSVVVAEGEPAHVLGLVDEDADFWTARPETVVVNLLGSPHRYVADVFAGSAPAPGGMFTQGEWDDSPWGPVLRDSVGWIGLRLAPDPREVGWRLLVDGVVEHAEVGEADPLIHLRGRYRD